MSFKERKLEAEVKLGLRKAIVVEVPKEEEVVTPKVVKENPEIEAPKKKVTSKKKSKND